ncbi:MAG TPA: S-adenosylmethionine decarboxylase [Vicinamibacterales bacterium]|nr:S-adenosylmethionine decarboxylase [Vicinamibacterales bacterium]
MPVATYDSRGLPAAPPPAAPAVRSFLIQVVCWNVALFGLLRLPWIDRYFVGALIEFQKSLVLWYGAPPPFGIVVNSSCSGADVMALCAGVILAYPVPWRRRLIGAAAGLALILVLNMVRIGTLFAVASDKALLDLLHVYVWPALLTAAVLLYVLFWIRGDARLIAGHGRWVRFGVTALAALLVYAAAAPWVLTSRGFHEAGVWTAATGGAVLERLGAAARTQGNILITSRGAFMVTQECLFTPVLPLYLAAVLSVPLAFRRRLFWLAMAVPIFFALGVARLLVLALPASIASTPVFLAHGFYQMVVGAALIVGAAHLAGNRSGFGASVRTAGALTAALAAAVIGGRIWTAGLLEATDLASLFVPAAVTTLASPRDQQGALVLMPGFQVALLTGFWFALHGARRAGRLALGLAALGVSQVAFLAAVGTWTQWTGIELPTLVVRTWALGVPMLIALTWLGAQGTRIEDAGYRRFWHDAGEEFPSLSGAASTELYLENEQRLIRQALPTLDGCTLLKTDLWDEAKNTRILQWAADCGARVFGIDLSEPIVRQARDAFGQRPLGPLVSDVRRLPFADGSFDAVYSMGTVEHFAETEASIRELARILKPGGRLILGVPNRYDPFLRPLLVALLSRIGLYAYGFEKSYSRRALRRMLESAGLEVRMESGILFIPGWLRMLDLWCYTRARPLAAVTRVLVWPFKWLHRVAPSLSRYGYLIASVAEKPARAGSTEAAARTGPQIELAREGVGSAPPVVQVGVEYVVDARGCDPEALQSLSRLQRLFSTVLDELSLHPVAPPVWHVFPGEGGVTGMVLLSESHLTIHTYPEAGSAAIDLYCCRSNAEWPWKERLPQILGAREVQVRILRRG